MNISFLAYGLFTLSYFEKLENCQGGSIIAWTRHKG